MTTMTGTPILSLRNVGVGYARGRQLWQRERFWALKDVSFDLHHGEVLGVIGRNGAGKSTLLQILADIIVPDRGSIVKERIRASLLSLSLGFIPHLSGRDNIILSGMLLGHRRAEVMRRMEQIIDFAEIGEFIDEPLKTYSSGMRARLGFSVGLQLEPDVLLVDEVMGVGDAAFREKSADAILQKVGSGRTVVLVSHNAGLIRQLCKRAVWIEQGESRLQGEVGMVLDAYTRAMHGAPARGEKGRAPLHVRAPERQRPPGSASSSAVVIQGISGTDP